MSIDFDIFLETLRMWPFHDKCHREDKNSISLLSKVRWFWISITIFACLVFFFNAYCLFDVGQNFWAFTDDVRRGSRDKQDKYRWAKRSQRLSGVSLLRSPIFFPFFPQCRAWSQAKTSQKVILFFPHEKFVFYFFKAIFHSISRYLRQSFGKWNWFVRTANAGFRDETWQSWTQTLNRPLCPCKWHTAVVFYLLSNRIFRKLCLW